MIKQNKLNFIYYLHTNHQILTLLWNCFIFDLFYLYWKRKKLVDTQKSVASWFIRYCQLLIKSLTFLLPRNIVTSAVKDINCQTRILWWNLIGKHMTCTCPSWGSFQFLPPFIDCSFLKCDIFYDQLNFFQDNISLLGKKYLNIISLWSFFEWMT